MNKSEKKRQLASFLEGNQRVTAELLAETVVITADGNKSLSVALDQEWNEILFKVNDFLFNNKIPAIGNFGAYSQAKIKKLIEKNESLELLDNGDLDISEHLVTIKINYFHPLQLIIEDINKSITDINKSTGSKIKTIKL
jgi:hypothetical protein